VGLKEQSRLKAMWERMQPHVSSRNVPSCVLSRLLVHAPLVCKTYCLSHPLMSCSRRLRKLLVC
jgi:hypothetical protein